MSCGSGSVPILLNSRCGSFCGVKSVVAKGCCDGGAGFRIVKFVRASYSVGCGGASGVALSACVLVPCPSAL